MRLKNNGLVNLRGPLPQETASPRTYRSRLNLARPEPVQHVPHLVVPAPSLARLRPYLPYCAPDRRVTVRPQKPGRLDAACLQIPQHLRPGLDRLSVGA